MADSYIEDLLAQASLELLRLRLVREVLVPSPAVGAEWTAVVPGGVIWRARSAFAVLATSAVVANRIASLDYTDGTRILHRTGGVAALTAGGTFRNAWALGWGESKQATSSIALNYALPDIPLPAGYTIGTNTNAIDVGDQWSGIVLMVEEWDETAIMQEAQEIDANLEDYISRRNYTRENR